MPRMGQPTIHEKKNFAKQSIEEVAFDLMFRGHLCNGCKSPKPCIRIQMFCAIDDLKPESVKVATKEMVRLGQVRTMRLKQPGNPMGKPGIRVGEAYACRMCQREAEKLASKAPSCYVIAIDRQEQTRGAMVTGGLIYSPHIIGG